MPDDPNAEPPLTPSPPYYESAPAHPPDHASSSPSPPLVDDDRDRDVGADRDDDRDARERDDRERDVGDRDVGDRDARDLDDAGPVWPWSGPLSTMGLVLALTVTVQFLLFLAEGLATKNADLTNGQLAGSPFDVLHRIGYPFNLSRVAVGLMVLELVIAVVLVSIPPALDRTTSDGHEVQASITLGLALIVAPLILVATVLAIRYNLRSFHVANRSVPGFFRLELYGYLVGVLGGALVAVLGAARAMSLRYRDRAEGWRADD